MNHLKEPITFKLGGPVRGPVNHLKEPIIFKLGGPVNHLKGLVSMGARKIFQVVKNLEIFEGKRFQLHGGLKNTPFFTHPILREDHFTPCKQGNLRKNCTYFPFKVL